MDKYPELEEEFDSQSGVEGDFLKREKELLGDDNDFAKDAPADEDAADEAAEFESQFPPVEETEQEAASGPTSAAASEPQTPTDRQTPSGAASSEPSQFIEEWKVKHQLEVERRDKAHKEQQEEIRKKAQTSIDDFYSNYNTKREESVAKVLKDAEQFVAQRDEQNTGSTWSKVHSLISDIGKPAEGVTPVDKTRFKELVKSLKDDPNAPGAAGY